MEQGTGEAVQVEEGSLYPALYRMEKRGWIEAKWDVSELKRKAKFYSLTPLGRGQLESETRRWVAFSAAVSKVLSPA
ncbi:MAG: helix-turn-helix transcriptional regulator [Acidobacteriota bacterium]